MSVHDARPGDIYVDEAGKLWRVVSYCEQPTVCVEEVEPSGGFPILDTGGKMVPSDTPPNSVQFVRERKSGGVSGLMWQGFKRIWRKEEPAP